MTFRARIAFTVLIGPFVILGTFLIATEGRLKSIESFRLSFWLAAAGASGAYILLGVYGGLLDRRVMRQCDTWRRLLVKLSGNKDEVRVAQ